MYEMILSCVVGIVCSLSPVRYTYDTFEMCKEQAALIASPLKADCIPLPRGSALPQGTEQK